jgi:hypothetical protein
VQNPKNFEFEEYFIEAPVIKEGELKNFHIRVTYAPEIIEGGSVTFDIAYEISLCIDGVVSGGDVFLSSKGQSRTFSKVRRVDKLFDMCFDPLIVTLDQSEVTTDMETLEDTGITITIAKLYRICDKISEYVPSYNSQVRFKDFMPTEKIKITEASSKHFGVKTKFGYGEYFSKDSFETRSVSEYRNINSLNRVWSIQFGTSLNLFNFLIKAGLDGGDCKKFDHQIDNTVYDVSSTEEDTGDEMELPPKKKVRKDSPHWSWSPAEVRDFIDGIDPSYRTLGWGTLFKINEIDGEVLMDMTDSKIKALGINVFGHRWKMLSRIKELDE